MEDLCILTTLTAYDCLHGRSGYISHPIKAESPEPTVWKGHRYNQQFDAKSLK